MKKMEDMMSEMGKKSAKKMSDQDISAKHEVLKELMDMAHGALSGKVKDGMHAMRASVIAKDPQSLEEGLGKAQEVVHEMKHDGEPDHYESPDDQDEPHGELGDHDSNSLPEEAERDEAGAEEKDGEEVDGQNQSPDVEHDEDELDGLFASKHRERAAARAKKK